MISSDPAITGKLLALLKELAPSIVRVDVVVQADNEVAQRLIPSAAANLNLAVRTFSVTRGEDVAPIVAGTKGNTDALLFSIGPVFNTMRHEIADLVAQAHLPAVYGFREIVLAGGLMAYGTNIPKNYAVRLNIPLVKFGFGASACL
jgi:putative ABC transport system substrate-binding protein